MENLAKITGRESKNYQSLNDTIEIIKEEKGKWGEKIFTLKCLKCGYIWKRSNKSYDKNPICPNCTERKPNAEGCGKKLTTEAWIERAKKVHPDYLYEKTQYKNANTSLIVTCPYHGDFKVIPKAFMHSGYECAKCKKEKKFKEDGKLVIEKLKELHPDYDYSNSIYKGIKKKINVFCPKHGEFTQLVYYGLNGGRCPKCIQEDKIGDLFCNTTEEFIEKAKKLYGEKYSYEKTDLKNRNKHGYVTITCPKHGDFYRAPTDFLRGEGCGHCDYKNRKTLDEFIKEAKRVHGEKYDYSLVEYEDGHKKVPIICHEKDEFGNEHGIFWQTPKNHLHGYGCKKCSGNYLDKDLFIAKANKIHDGKYLYDEVEYKTTKTLVKILCPEHGYFMQQPSSHLNGRGCPLCKTSHLERSVKKALEKSGVLHIYQYRNKDVFDKQSIDFYIPGTKLGIECQGEQHFISNFFKSKGIEYAENHLKYIQELDERKRKKCKEEGIELVYFFEPKFEKYEKSGNRHFTNAEDLINYIKERKKDSVT